MEYIGPKTVDVNGSPYPCEDYVQWLEKCVAELNHQLKASTQNNASLRQQIASYRAYASKRARWEHDYLPYSDDEDRR